MKRFLLYIILICGLHGHAQLKIFGKDPIIHLENFDKQRVHWGYFLGFNSYGFKFDYIDAPDVDVIVKQTTGFNVGLVGNLRIMEHLDLRFEPGLYYTQRDLTFPGFERESDAFREVKSTYIHFPLLLKFSAKRAGNVKPYLVGGFSKTLNLSSGYNSLDDNYTGTFRMKQWTTNYEIGFGIDMYLEYFKFSPSIRGVFGLNDELIRDNNPDSPWTSNIGSMKTRAILVNFTFH
ncbi:porin family protein [Flavobacterium beibuense]|uniref:PorT protein n=1 Tax=Flavobacterium beibuense TaxID=657326 RepID=A0A444WCC4_9FLAO|nr:porin family protein [Flavobacterium beibuense]RYJ43404.1 PorT protein [Flavobacterium beibuense]